ncbi:hypothetical protein GCM10009760_21290 [Kitasatospora kazusensis]|uniref:KedN5 family methylcobalamin-dependent radical SAM C-methyltransferase n=1 Tax=Kitasatospora kazusensis TaxID=407974 RepID=A0ABP5KYJ2_9ACTN
MSEKKRAWLIQQGVWATAKDSLPLAAAYMKAYALDDDRIASEMDVEVFSFDGGVTLAGLADWLIAKNEELPDVLAFSVLGWNYRTFGSLAETYKQLKPDGWVVFGGTHVAYQGDRVFAMFPEVDIVVNGEGELTFRDLLLANLDGRHPATTDEQILGISFVNSDGKVATTPDRPRIENLDIIPSPFLTGSIPLTNEQGDFRYDVALMETNRGCPYTCSFCYWGGAIGQRIRSFSRERLRRELEVFGRHKVHTIVLCDANFGMLQSDIEFIEDFVEVRNKYGFPKALETSWAKNKSAMFYKIVKLMQEEGLHTTFTLALQTLDDTTLEHMNRRNMKVNQWEDLAEWLYKENLECYAQLIWGAPGETIESFLAGYDKLARYSTRIACYPLLILPNTDYAKNKNELGMVTVRGDNDDFEYVLSHETMTAAENRQMRRFIFWSRLLVETSIIRYTWTAVRSLTDLPLSKAVWALMEWFSASDDPAAAPLREYMEKSIIDQEVISPAIEYLLGQAAAKRVLAQAWNECIRPHFGTDSAEILDEVFRYDLITLPAYTSDQESRSAEFPSDDLPRIVRDGQEYHVWRDVHLKHDVPSLVRALRAGEDHERFLAETVTTLHYRVDADTVVGPTGHGELIYFMGWSDS